MIADLTRIKPIHPFAARMASEIAFEALKDLHPEALILDPMAGSGTVLKTVSSLGFNGIGIDIDPLAVMLSSAWTSTINEVGFMRKVSEVIKKVNNLDDKSITLPWIDGNIDTTDFITYWFGLTQINDLRKLCFVVNHETGKYRDILKVALSKLIIAKNKGASLAADISHSRPHKVREINDFNVVVEFEKTCIRICKIMIDNPSNGKIKVSLGDARKLKLRTGSIDAIITSPPYLNAIDYMRGHKMALVWLGFTINELSTIRSSSVGAERAPDSAANLKLAKRLVSGISDINSLPNRKINMIHRYALDINKIMRESSRVLKSTGKATFVIGNTTQNGVFIENTTIARNAALDFNLELVDFHVREIPENRRYLPPPNLKNTSSLNKRMRTEAVMTFLKKP